MPGISPGRRRPSLGRSRRGRGSRRGRRGGAPARSSFGARLRRRVPQYGHSVTNALTSDPQLLQTTNRSAPLDIGPILGGAGWRIGSPCSGWPRMPVALAPGSRSRQSGSGAFRPRRARRRTRPATSPWRGSTPASISGTPISMPKTEPTAAVLGSPAQDDNGHGTLVGLLHVDGRPAANRLHVDALHLRPAATP